MFKHPNAVCMTYMQHFALSMNLGFIFIKGAFKAFIHAIIPDMFITSSSDTIKYANHIVQVSGCRKGQE